MESVIATREDVLHFLSTQRSPFGYRYDSGDGHGNGSGFGSGFGDGNGSGFGSGYDDGAGYSDCYGDGAGVGSGFGYGHDDGYGYPYPYEYGSCHGSDNGGYVDGNGDIKALNGNIVDYVDAIPTIITQVHDNIACGYIISSDLTLSPCYIAKVGNSFAHGYTLREAVAYAEEKEINNMPIKERIKKFVETFGSLDSEHTGKRFYDWHHILTSSCSFGRNSFCKDHNINLDNMYTVRYFLDITKNSYGSNVIKLIRKAYKILDE